MKNRLIFLFIFSFPYFNSLNAYPMFDLDVGFGNSQVTNIDVLYYLKHHTGKFFSAAGVLLSGALFKEQISNFILDHNKECTGVSIALLGTLYLLKDKWAKYIPDPADPLTKTTGGGEGENIYAFSKCDARIYRPGEIKVTFKDVAGLETAKEELQDIISYLKDAKPFHKMGARIPKGVLLSGSPGNGKTLLARAVAGEANCPFIYVSGSQFVEMLVGVGAARIRNLFTMARELSPCILFIDEIDAIGEKRLSSMGTSAEQSHALNQLLAEMDGFEQKNQVIVLGATNRAEVLDDALTRPGRFDRKVEVNSPHIKDRRDILTLHLRQRKLGESIDVNKIARGTKGYSGADLESLVNEAAIIAVREQKEKGAKLVSGIMMRHIDEARDVHEMGKETKGIDFEEQDYWETAVHESGHAILRVVQEHVRYALYKVTITPRDRTLGTTHGILKRENCKYTQEEMIGEIIVSLGGGVAQELVYGERCAGISGDYTAARHIATEMVMKYGMSEEFKDVAFMQYVDHQDQLPDEIATKIHKEVVRIIQECREVAVQLLTKHRKELDALTDLLTKKYTVYGNEVYALCGMPEPGIEYMLTNEG